MKPDKLAKAVVDKARRDMTPSLYARDAIIDPDYSGSGLPSVIFIEDMDSQTLSGPFPYLASYSPMAGDVVSLQPRANSSYLIVGKVIKS
jgi:hypothetical protein